MKVAKFPCHGLIAPSSILLVLSGIINSGSNSILIPKPLHSLHAPKGELKEKDLGSIFPILMLQNGQELYLENKNSLLSIMVITIPFAKLVAVCKD